MSCGLKAFTGLCLLIICSACVASNQDMMNLNDQFIALNRRVSTLEQGQGTMETKIGSDLETRFKTIYATQSEIRLELDRVKGELHKLTNRVEDNDNLIKRTFEKDLTGQDAFKTELADLSTRVKELDKVVKELDGKLKAGVDAAPKSQPSPPPTLPGPVATPSLGPGNVKDEDLYNTAYNAFKEAKYVESIKDFKALIEKFPKSDYADNAQFWIGECYMSLKQYDLAILAYQDVIKNYPAGNKVPNAMLRQGVAAELYGDKKLARALYKKVMEKFPNSSEAKTAKERLSKLP